MKQGVADFRAQPQTTTSSRERTVRALSLMNTNPRYIPLRVSVYELRGRPRVMEVSQISHAVREELKC
jgi:hypothetical protein